MSIETAYFIGHGSPMNALEHNAQTQQWQSMLQGSKPRAILMISAHWYTHGTAVTAMNFPRTIHDFYGFPADLYQIQYPAQGCPELATQIKSLLAPAEVQLNMNWGLDHGAWSVLIHMFPNADVPVVQLSLDQNLTPLEHLQLAKKLASLRQQGVMIIGSGNVVHNLRMLDWQSTQPPLWAEQFNYKIKELLLENNLKGLAQYQNIGEAARLAVPHPDHFLPLLYVLGTGLDGDEISLFNDEILYGALSMLSVKLSTKV
ncbi:4,5-DOPA dioxygenase extradiol [Rheinheimera sp.]|jgi:4,5-DOPA dioxygenase extradiol|uniref:4,5-DOPA-extradiol-dioxygenase n=1 Tax=Rheinheimera sp. TaxID=1869214 RepID=UPI002618B362|nr:4,5-DOPA dioxygenase extradiol [Rheinheimera sp.]MCA1928571.1 4,5-DOPA dioxygenase extradiol [Rheinheimera sp.]